MLTAKGKRRTVKKKIIPDKTTESEQEKPGKEVQLNL